MADNIELMAGTDSLEDIPSCARRIRKPRLMKILSLTIQEDGSLRTKIDVPPCFVPPGPPGHWADDDVAAHIAWEVRQLAHDPCPGLVSIHHAGSPAMRVDSHGEAVPCMSDGATSTPVVVEARISSPEGTPYHSERGLRVRLVLGEHYPAAPPEVNFMQTVHHFFLDNENGLPEIFYELLTSLVADLAEDLGQPYPMHTLRATLQLVHHVLQSPLHPCEGCQDQFDAYSRMHAQRTETIESYAAHCAHPELYDPETGWRDDWLHPDLRSALAHLRSTGDEEQLRALLQPCAEGVYSFPCLTDAACQMFVDEVDAYAASGLPSARPNSMNKYGLVVNEIGMEAVFDEFQSQVLQPIARLLFPVEGCSLDRHHSFMVQYSMGKDLGLDMHTDNSDVTFNVCCGREFQGAGLTFCGDMGEGRHRLFSYRHQHVKGHAVVHLGRRRHGADDLSSGERLNLIVWNTNLAYRNSSGYLDLQRQQRYEKEVGPPDAVCLSYTHDRDYLQYKDKPAAHAKMTRRGWCPPRFAAHDAAPSPAPPDVSSTDLPADFSGGYNDDDERAAEGGEAALISVGAGEVEATLEDAKMVQRVLNDLVGLQKPAEGTTHMGDGDGPPVAGRLESADEIFTPQEELARLM